MIIITSPRKRSSDWMRGLFSVGESIKDLVLKTNALFWTGGESGHYIPFGAKPVGRYIAFEI